MIDYQTSGTGDKTNKCKVGWANGWVESLIICSFHTATTKETMLSNWIMTPSFQTMSFDIQRRLSSPSSLLDLRESGIGNQTIFTMPSTGELEKQQNSHGRPVHKASALSLKAEVSWPSSQALRPLPSIRPPDRP